MTYPTLTKDSALNAETFTLASLHTAYPGTSGSSEVSGGSPAYAKKAITVNASSGGSRLLNAGVTFDVPACTVKWIGFWNVGTFLFGVPNGGATPKNFMAVPSSDLIYATGHGWSDTQKITFFGTPPSGLTEGATYFVRDSTAGRLLTSPDPRLRGAGSLRSPRTCTARRARTPLRPSRSPFQTDGFDRSRCLPQACGVHRAR
jgi:hypothetical protein